MSTPKGCLLVFLSAVLLNNTAQARQSFLEEWRAIYPESSSSRRNCQLCHATSTGGEPWNGYGFDVRTRYIEINRFDMRTAIVDVEALNSDADIEGLSNIEEIQQGFDPGWRSPGLNFILFSDMTFDQITSPFGDTDAKATDFCFVVPSLERGRVVTICL